MDDKIDQKIRNILSDLKVAQKKSEEFYATEVLDPHSSKSSNNIYEMGLAFDDKKRLMVELKLAQSEKFSDKFSSEEVEYLKIEKDKLNKKVKAWQNNQFPSQFRE